MIVHNRLISSVNGPGRRAVVWLQGCDLGCRGCWNPSTHSFDHADDETPLSIANWISSQKGIEGVTFSGGEPMQQAADLLQVLREVRDNQPQLSFGMFTGYNLAELEEGRFKFRSVARDEARGNTIPWIGEPTATSSCWRQIRRLLDFAVAGRFQQSKTSTAAPMRSSSNQQLHLFSDRYTESDFPTQSVEITIRPGGLTTITGFPVGVKL
jgi:anaerobic ribonucleoside-triphosphate reductase activating protein